MLRFPYRRVWTEPGPAIASPRLGLFRRLIRLLTGQSASTQQAPTPVHDNAPRPVVSIRIRGPVASRRLKSALLHTGSQDTPNCRSAFPGRREPPRLIESGTVRSGWKARPTNSLQSPMALAEPLGILLGGDRQAIKWRGQRYWVEFHDVELELTHNDLAWRWRAHVGFTPAPLSYALLGHRGCLDLLDAKFCGADQVVELETNRRYPGIVGPAA